MKYLSVCSGIEAATAAWHGLGWTPVAFSEIDKFAAAVLAHHYPNVPNWGDMTKFKEWPNADVDVLVGGTPCQSFSVAGLRAGLADPRGNLALTYLAIAERYRPKWLVWENVPGVLSADGGRAFGAIIGGMVELGYCPAWRVLDAQYIRTRRYPHAVPQRRRRVFVVAHFGDWRRAAAVLFDRESLSGNPAPSRETGETTAHSVAPCIGASGRGFERAGETRGQDPVVATCPTLRAGGNRTGGDRPPGTDVDTCESLRPTPAVAFAQNTRDEVRMLGGDSSIAGALTAQPGAKQQTYLAEPFTIVERGRDGGQSLESRQDGTANAIFTPNGGRGGMGVGAIATPMAVRRLTPVECERLQGFSDDFTRIPWRNKPADQCPDGPRYKALGNSMATNVMEWIGERIAGVVA